MLMIVTWMEGASAEKNKSSNSIFKLPYVTIGNILKIAVTKQVYYVYIYIYSIQKVRYKLGRCNVSG